MQEKELSLDEATKVWWAWAWRTIVVTVPLHLIVGYVWPQIGAEKFLQAEFFLVIVDLAVSVYFLRTAISKGYSDFRVMAVERDGSSQ
jgi:hypothetical protein